ncbi:MAG: hypothetical protein Q8O67_16135 [Deltaproteobacteria bacterium]|nr:hypothetical protein [Deltaproteobacteria bacterium]
MTSPLLVHNDDNDARRRLLRTLMGELFQAERSAEMHCQREARRYARELSATALWGICRQARGAMARLGEIADERHFPIVKGAKLLGSFFSGLREAVIDRFFLNGERSWRATLLGLRHGIDVAVSLRLVAAALDDDVIVAFCDDLLGKRAPLVKEVEDTLWWFAEHPRRALAGAR